MFVQDCGHNLLFILSKMFLCGLRVRVGNLESKTNFCVEQ